MYVNGILANRIKKMYILAIMAIIIILILNMIAWAPIVSESMEINEDWADHKENYDDHYDCAACEEYKEDLAPYNQQGANLWRQTVTDCTLIALFSAICYGVGLLIEMKQDKSSGAQ